MFIIFGRVFLCQYFTKGIVRIPKCCPWSIVRKFSIGMFNECVTKIWINRDKYIVNYLPISENVLQEEKIYNAKYDRSFLLRCIWHREVNPPILKYKKLFFRPNHVIHDGISVFHNSWPDIKHMYDVCGFLKKSTKQGVGVARNIAPLKKYLSFHELAFTLINLQQSFISLCDLCLWSVQTFSICMHIVLHKIITCWCQSVVLLIPLLWQAEICSCGIICPNHYEKQR